MPRPAAQSLIAAACILIAGCQSPNNPKADTTIMCEAGTTRAYSIAHNMVDTYFVSRTPSADGACGANRGLHD